ncbi:sigma-54 interaction domain-containing protein [Bacillus seohaeanensis]|uniref:HTH-type transcriptional regulatory protein TyrR n=1 Tax=Bacillus seohaeanensis TaxID=284580 RepID=A0ABW5RVK7_9BACI
MGQEGNCQGLIDVSSDFEQDLQAVFESSFDVIYVADGEGTTLRVSAAAEKMWGVKPEELVGKKAFEHEQKGFFTPSVVSLVLEKKEKVQAIQTTKTGRRLLVVGTPIKDEDGSILRVVNTSRDITEETELKQEIQNVKSLMEGYRTELEELREKEKQESTIIYNSKAMDNVCVLAKKVSKTNATVLITGESGVGKEVIASYIHQNSERKTKPFIKVNCGALPESLLESELFGYEPGSFTGALHKTKRGMFELAHKGTIFLDEIGEIPVNLQVKLLRVLQEKEFHRLGGSSPIKVDVRILAATNQNLVKNVENGKFRQDLYYRLHVIPIHIPPLRERKEDILPLSLDFLTTYNEKFQQNKRISNEAMKAISSYDFPGNVRELQNLIERLSILSEQDEITNYDLPSEFQRKHEIAHLVEVNDILPLKEAQWLVEKELLLLTKKRYGTTTKMAKALGVNQSTISRKLQQYAIGHDSMH